MNVKDVENAIEEFLEIRKTIAAVGGPNEGTVRATYDQKLCAAAIGVMMLFKFGGRPAQVPIAPVSRRTFAEIHGLMRQIGNVDVFSRNTATGREVIDLGVVRIMASVSPEL